jgi:hypothetical protein
VIAKQTEAHRFVDVVDVATVATMRKIEKSLKAHQTATGPLGGLLKNIK